MARSAVVLCVGSAVERLAASGWVRPVPRVWRGKLELKPGQRDGHSEIGDPAEAAAGGGQETAGGEAPGVAGRLFSQSCVMGCDADRVRGGLVRSSAGAGRGAGTHPDASLAREP